ncbi:MAG: hypothetical protein GEU99_14065 [Luteitalea sp.]|nr:hypothetical protein [Luteitalea sp.]
MSALNPVNQPPHEHPEERLDSWKEIAAFLRRGVRTVQRWERTEDLPVRRHVHERGGSVYAYKSETLEWYRGRQARLARLSVDETLPPEDRPRALSPHGRVAAGPPAAPRQWVRSLVPISAALIVGIGAVVGWSVLSAPRPFVGQTRTVLSVVGRASQSVLSPDGQRVAFTWNGEGEFGNLDLYVKSVGNGPPRRLTGDPTNEHSPAWSPDGSKLAFLRDGAGAFMIGLQGGTPTLLEPQRPNAVYGVGMSWSLDGRFLYFPERRIAREPMSIYQLSVADGGVRRLTTPRDGAGDMYAAVAPDGRQLAFIRQSANLAADLYRLRIGDDGRPATEPRRLTFQSSRIAGLDWLPDGQGIVFSSDHSGGRRLWMLRLGAWGRQSLEPLAFAGEQAFQPSVAKAARQHVVYSRRYWPAAIWRLELARPDRPAGPPVKLIGSTRQDLEPAWSPDGRRIAFVSTRTGHTEIWVSQADGRAATQVTSFGGPRTHKPAWSPDGRWLAFASGRERRSSVFIIAATGGSPRSLTPADMHCYQPAWSADGRRLYFTSDRSGAPEVWSIPVAGGSPVRATRQGGIQAQVSQDGAWVYYRRNGLWRMPASGGAAREIIEGYVGNYAVGDRGIYFDRGFGDYADPEIYYRDFDSGRTTLLTRLDRRMSDGLAVSRDGRALLLTLNDRQSSELVLVSANLGRRLARVGY